MSQWNKKLKKSDSVCRSPTAYHNLSREQQSPACRSPARRPGKVGEFSLFSEKNKLLV